MFAFAFLKVVNIICISSRINLFKLCFAFNSNQLFSQIRSRKFCLANSKRNQTMWRHSSSTDKRKEICTQLSDLDQRILESKGVPIMC